MSNSIANGVRGYIGYSNNPEVNPTKPAITRFNIGTANDAQQNSGSSDSYGSQGSTQVTSQNILALLELAAKQHINLPASGSAPQNMGTLGGSVTPMSQGSPLSTQGGFIGIDIPKK